MPRTQLTTKERQGGAEREAKLMHTAAKDTTGHQHFLQEPLAERDRMLFSLVQLGFTCCCWGF